jgi:hypothetical protein
MTLADLGIGCDLFFQAVGQPCFGNCQVVMSLEVHPTLGIGSKNPRKPEGGIRRDGSLSGYDFAYSPLGHPHGLGKPVLADTHRFQKVLQEDFTRMYRRHLSFHTSSPSMVVDDLDIVGVSFMPPETDTPLIVDADAPLSFSVSPQFFQPVRRRDTKEIKAGGCVNQSQFSQGGLLDIPWKSGGKEPAKYFQGFLTPECLDHGKIVTARDSIVKRYYYAPRKPPSVWNMSLVLLLPCDFSVVRIATR